MKTEENLDCILQQYNTQMDAYFAKLYERQPQLPMPLSGGVEAWPIWREQFGARLQSCLQGFPAQYEPLQAKRLHRQAADGYERQLWQFSGEAGMEIPAYLLVPSGAEKEALQGGRRYPVVIAVCGHGAGMTEICGLTADHMPREEGTGYQKDFAVALCRQGMVVLAPEMLGFGLRRFSEDQEKGAGQSSCFRMSTNLLMMGKTMAGVRVREVQRCLDFLQTLPFVDAAKIGCMGISGGGTTLMYAAALDERLKATVISGAGCTYRDSILSIFHCIDNFVPGLYEQGEMFDVLGMVAPRALMLEAGRQDDIFPLAGVQKCYAQLKQAYRQQRAEDKLRLSLFDGGHQIGGMESYAFLKKHLE